MTDDEAFMKLYKQNSGRVLAWLTRALGPGADREDVMQQVFLQLYRALPAFRGDSSPDTFLFRIMSNVTMDHLRKHRRRPVVEDGAGMEEIVEGRPTPEDCYRRKQQLERLLALLPYLEAEQRQAFVLVVIEGVPAAVAAARLGSSTQQVRQRAARARRLLRAMLRQQEKQRRAGGKPDGERPSAERDWRSAESDAM
jgi:RNA polymerase sigma-70 factor, ECF subfamily